jgi:hypothetical protein
MSFYLTEEPLPPSMLRALTWPASCVATDFVHSPMIFHARSTEFGINQREEVSDTSLGAS